MLLVVGCRYVLAFSALLVTIGWFDEVNISRLVVGHTHSYIGKLMSGLRSTCLIYVV